MATPPPGKDATASELRSDDWNALGEKRMEPGRLSRNLGWLVARFIDPVLPGPGEAGGYLGIRRARVLVGGAFAAGLTCMLFVLQRWFDGLEGLPLLTLAVSGLGFFSVPVLLRVTRRVAVAAIPALLLLTIILPLDAYAFGGPSAPSFLAALAVPLMATFFVGPRWGLIVAVILSAEVMGLLVLARSGHAFPTPPPAERLDLMHAVATVGMLGFIAVLAYLYEDQRRVTERALAASERRYELAAEAANDGIFEWSPETDEVHMSRMLEEFLEVDRADGPHKAADFLDRVHDEDRESLADTVREGLANRGRFEVQFRLARNPGEYHWFDCRVLLTRGDNQPTRVVGTMRDITESRRVAALQSEFVSAVSHELRTPLTSIRGSLSLLLAGVGGELPAGKPVELLKIAESNSARLLALVNDLLDMQKIQAGELDLEREDFDLGVAVDDAVASNRPYADQRRIALEHRVSQEARLLTHSDRRRVTQVLSNLLSNASKFSAEGSTVTVSTLAFPRVLRVEVADRGAGIPPDFEGRLFDRFARADGADDASQPGTGLGLAISKEIMERLGGRIGYRPRPDGGSIFWFELAGRATDLNVLEQTGRYTDGKGSAWRAG